MKVTVRIDGVEVDLDDSITTHIQEVTKKTIEENIDDIVRNVVKTQLKSAALVQIQSNETRQIMLDKVKPIIEEMLK